MTSNEQLNILSDLFNARRDNILLAWRKMDRADPSQTTGRSLTIGQFLDHIPAILDAYELRLCSHPGGADARTAETQKQEEGVKHGLHRWQQGYQLTELITECGHFQRCVFEELARIADAHPELEPATLVEAHRQLIQLTNDTISESAGQYERMQQAQAAGRVGDLKDALATVSQLEQHRATLIHQAVHDLNSDVIGVRMAATRIGQSNMAEPERLESALFLERAVAGLNGMLGELMQLARLEAGQEKRKLANFNAAEVITKLCESNQPYARERELYLKTEGPSRLEIEGDSDKVRRIAKNLLLNALKYTDEGGVVVSWGEEKENWWLMVKDTGPGIISFSGQLLKEGLQEATASAKESDEKNAPCKNESSKVLAAPDDQDQPTQATHSQHGEGLGISIVKRLCELLDASLEVTSSAEEGTTFRVVFPCSYTNSK